MRTEKEVTNFLVFLTVSAATVELTPIQAVDVKVH